MLELLIATGIFLALLFVAFGGALVQWTFLVGAGFLVAAAGFLLGVAAGAGYHVALYRALSPAGLLGPDWWWRPTRYNTHLDGSARRKVMPWYYAGLASVIVDFAGCLMILAGILIM